MQAARSARRSRSGTSSAASASFRHGPRLLGPGVRRRRTSAQLIADAARRRLPARRLHRRGNPRRSRTLCRRTAAAIADGQVVGWFQGRMEWGPRALGNRSIVCDPRRADMKAILNAKIKRARVFRPFAPSVLEEAVVGMVRGGRCTSRS